MCFKIKRIYKFNYYLYQMYKLIFNVIHVTIYIVIKGLNKTLYYKSLKYATVFWAGKYLK